jgi:hypothetical protein
MAGRFFTKHFSEIDLTDPFFDSLKNDYPGSENSTGFIEWFKKKSLEGASALLFEDEAGIGAFIVLKDETDEIALKECTLPKKQRIKISTFRIADRYHRQRIGEGAIGLILWKWQKSNISDIYLTVFDKHTTLISQFEKFGFKKCGYNNNGENVLIRTKDEINFTDCYKSFPYLQSNFDYAGYIIIDDIYHDTMFAYSELANTKFLQSQVHRSVSNGLSKIYVSSAYVSHYQIGEPVFIYRKYTQGRGKRYKSCLTSICVVNNVIQAKRDYKFLMTFDELKKAIGNKSVFDENEIYDKYMYFKNLIVLELLYIGYFGAGNNVNMDWLDNNGLWTPNNQYPTEKKLTLEQFKKILLEGNVDVSNVIID